MCEIFEIGEGNCCVNLGCCHCRFSVFVNVKVFHVKKILYLAEIHDKAKSKSEPSNYCIIMFFFWEFLSVLINQRLSSSEITNLRDHLFYHCPAEREEKEIGRIE